ncbi:DUF397 domain-containing protein [Actinosynnema pretiosum subsp. pretiosum]|uniref:DUF397 domain-containing protein n=2 Tax=Actinosynnema TaxID=40566 RepID=C6WKC4_ACTMD|nr:DUF397 domain-containing protein [Actinosynnema mirum]ACU40175.1 protein of unknown function DUF397 [Actinosynnema mirum DSM 43827]AXX33690.1 hypothetical protein APASM_6325 [Actinosynnema pretiosum subsp. pretiosum]QUF02534.1 DUF397 domain-containing protein [Actinosynnema pretiosum subsp. pretiosum]
MADQRWRKSSSSTTNPDCVELSITPDATSVRDSKDPSGGRLRFGRSSFSGFLDRIKREGKG